MGISNAFSASTRKPPSAVGMALGVGVRVCSEGIALGFRIDIALGFRIDIIRDTAAVDAAGSEFAVLRGIAPLRVLTPEGKKNPEERYFTGGSVPNEKRAHVVNS